MDTKNVELVDLSQLKQELVKHFHYICKECNVIKYIEMDIVKNKHLINRYDVLRGLILLIHSETVKSLDLLIDIINVFGITLDEVVGTKFKLLEYAFIHDNIEVVHYLIEKFNIKFNYLESRQKRTFVDTILFNTSRRCLKYLFETKQLTSQDINEVPPYFVSNKIFLQELVKNYGYSNYSIPIVPYDYRKPSDRYRENRRNNYKMFSSRQPKRADLDLDWRKPISKTIKARG